MPKLMLTEFMASVVFTIVWDKYQGSQFQKGLNLKFEELRDLIFEMDSEEIENFAQEIDFNVHDHVLEHVEDHHQEIGLADWSLDELRGMVSSSEWEDLVGGDLGENIEYWYGTHIPDTDIFDATREHLLEFHKYAYIRRLMI
jgi:hypothetical protein